MNIKTLFARFAVAARDNFARLAMCTISIAFFCSQASAQLAFTKDAMFEQQATGDAGTSFSQQNPGSEKIAAPPIDPSLSPDWLSQPSTPGAKPTLVVGYYNLSQGLLAGYQASNGRRILLQSVWLSNGRVMSSATHVNPQTGRLQTFYGPRKQVDASMGKVSAHIQFAGVDVMAYLKDTRVRGPAPRADTVNDFIDSESGQAFFEAVPVLYALLEPLETDPNLATLQAPFGVLVTGLQIATTKYAGFTQADSVLGPAHANVLRNDCHGATCAFSGKRFMIHKNGLFDAVSKSKSLPSKSASEQGVGGAAAASPFPGVRAILQSNGVCTQEEMQGNCFGRCGRGCDGQTWAGNHYTLACWAHDLCACMWSEADCIFFTSGSPPYGYCPDCGDLFDAVISWLGEIIWEIVDWLLGGPDYSGLINYP